MAIMRIECPECGAGLKSPTGFKAGQSVACPKCETYFTVEEPEDDEDRSAKKKPVKAASRADDDDDAENEKPRKKKKKKSRADDDDDEGGGKSYATSPLRFIVLGILVVIMMVLGIMLIMKKRGEKEETNAAGDPPAVQPSGPRGDVPPGGGPGGGPPFPGPGGLGGFQPVAGGLNPGGGPPNVVVPKKGGFTAPKKDFNPPGFAAGPDPIAGLLGESPRAGTAESTQLLESHRKKLIGSWEGTTADGAIHKVNYQASGQFTHDVTGGAKASSSTGTWNISGLVGTRGVKINRGTVTLKAVFENDELLHDTTTPGVAVVLRKK